MKLTENIAKKLNLEIYKLNEVETFNFIVDFLTKEGIPFETHNKNIFGLNHYGSPCFCAHLDTVMDSDMKKELIYDSYGGILSRKNGILGADDKAGVAILLHHIRDINFAFFHSEEIGGIGSTEMSDHEFFVESIEVINVPCFIQFDRKGRNDMIGTLNYYCCDDLAKEIEEKTHYKTAKGIYTDIDNLCHIIPGVNLSCGYYNGHSNSEHLIVSEFLMALNTVPALNKIRGKYEIAEDDRYSNLFSFDSGNEFTIEFSEDEFTDGEMQYLRDALFISMEDIEKFGKRYFRDLGILDDYYGYTTYSDTNYEYNYDDYHAQIIGAMLEYDETEYDF